MLLTLTFTSIISCILIVMMYILPLISIHKKTDREKASPFECGFDPLSKPRISFSVHFFSISLMFLIFDIEITLILPTPLLAHKIKTIHWLSSCTFLFSILIMGLVMEWKEGSMNWN